ncbi:hypothetical protein C4K03_3019 [Pseudomonas synxantha]|uniref:Uncharacterized protein n=1 Tax=Pseudomonas synxantha TaxID=47883 RepID=A0A3G7U727_9PSED|nr:hypothetical protein C4K03_3019 [Pseudomonas synxantha]
MPTTASLSKPIQLAERLGAVLLLVATLSGAPLFFSAERVSP